MSELITTSSLLLVFFGFLIGIFSVIVGGGMFFSVPVMQWLFPHASFGVVVGNLKVGSFFRSIGSTISTHKKIEYLDNIKIAALALPGTMIGVSIISNLDQKWLFPAIVVAVFLAFFAPKVAHLVNKKTFYLASFLSGIYAGFFGAGIGVLLIALLRTKYTKDTEIAFVKIQARFLEFLLVIAAVITHILHGNTVFSIWLPWSVGALAGGYAGGIILNRLGNLPGTVQKYVLYFSFALALIVAGSKLF